MKWSKRLYWLCLTAQKQHSFTVILLFSYLFYLDCCLPAVIHHCSILVQLINVEWVAPFGQLSTVTTAFRFYFRYFTSFYWYLLTLNNVECDNETTLLEWLSIAMIKFWSEFQYSDALTSLLDSWRRDQNQTFVLYDTRIGVKFVNVLSYSLAFYEIWFLPNSLNINTRS